MDVDVEALEESLVEGLLILRIHGKTHVSTVVVEPHLEVLGHTAAVPDTNSGSMSFR